MQTRGMRAEKPAGESPGFSRGRSQPSNWYLAAQRAAAVAHYLDQYHDMQSQGLKIEAFGPPPVEAQGVPRRRPEKRRVEILVTPSER